jgi:hypothetical protein
LESIIAEQITTVPIQGETALSDGGFNRTTLEEVCGYTAEEAREADGFLQGIGLPETLGAGVLEELHAGIQTAVVKNRGRGREALRADTAAMLGDQERTGYKTARSSGGTVALTRTGGGQGTLENGRAGAFNLPETESEYTARNPSGTTVSGYSGTDSAARAVGYTVEGNRGEAPATGSHEKPGPLAWGPAERGRTWNGGTDGGNTTVFPGGVSAAAGHQRDMPKAPIVPTPNVNGGFGETGLSAGKPNNSIRDLELERLRRIEANYEKDKAVLAKEQAPALARSDSREAGHAEGSGEEEVDLKKTAQRQISDIIEELRRRQGV